MVHFPEQFYKIHDTVFDKEPGEQQKFWDTRHIQIDKNGQLKWVKVKKRGFDISGKSVAMVLRW